MRRRYYEPVFGYAKSTANATASLCGYENRAQRWLQLRIYLFGGQWISKGRKRDNGQERDPSAAPCFRKESSRGVINHAVAPISHCFRLRLTRSLTTSLACCRRTYNAAALLDGGLVGLTGTFMLTRRLIGRAA